MTKAKKHLGFLFMLLTLGFGVTTVISVLTGNFWGVIVGGFLTMYFAEKMVETARPDKNGDHA